MRVFCAGFNLYGQFRKFPDSCIESFQICDYPDVCDIKISHAYLLLKNKVKSPIDLNISNQAREIINIHGFIENKTHQTKDLIFDRNIKEIAVGESKCLFLCDDGTIFTINNNNSSNYEIQTIPEFVRTEQNPKDLTNDCIIKIAIGSRINCVISRLGYGFCIPSKINAQIQNIKNVGCGAEHCLILTENGLIYSFGGGSRGQLGHSNVEDLSDPKIIEALSGIKIIKISCGNWHSIALSADGDIYAWGSNSNGQLGLETNKRETVNKVSIMASPVVVDLELDKNVIDVACGSKHTIVLLDNSKLYGCGCNKYKQLGIQTEDDNVMSFKFLYDFKDFNVLGLRCGTWNTAVLVN